MNSNLTEAKIRIFVFGTLRKGARLDFYMDGSEFRGMYYTEGQLMKSELGGAYISFSYKNVYTIGELYMVNFPSLQRLNHLESVSGEFPIGYDLDVIPIWKLERDKEPDFDPNKQERALFYRRRADPEKLMQGDWVNRPKPMKEIERFLTVNDKIELTENDIIQHLSNYLCH